jgi:ABC-type branched-subunit amino acid transport system substrate-binding protein
VRPGQRRAYTRIIARDDDQARAMATELRRRGHRNLFVLDDASGSSTLGLQLGSYFASAARSSGLRVVGRASWGGQRRLTAVARRVARSGADGVYVSGELDRGAGSVVRALRRALPTAGRGARGVLISSTVLPIAAMPERGRALAAQLARDQRVARIHPAAVYAAQAAEVAIDAISRSDGSRGSVRRALRATDLLAAPLGHISFDPRGDLRGARVAVVRVMRRGGTHDLLSTEGADLVGLHP